ncbi:hypothetical protein HMPREF0380_00674 [Eubacterium infirmum F0142]|nr:hypothetical protein HMPREF0380_00674 [Eubacterium infirmum F0142]
MLKKTVSLIIILCLSLAGISLLSACNKGSDVKNEKLKQKNAKAKPEEEELSKEEIIKRYKEASEFIINMFYSASRDKIDENDSFNAENGSKYYRFTYKNINSISEFKKEMGRYFTDEVCEYYLNYDENLRDKFVEKDGKLYIQILGGIGFRDGYTAYVEKASEKNKYKIYLIYESTLEYGVAKNVLNFSEQKISASGQNRKKISAINYKKTKNGWKFDAGIIPYPIGLQDGEVPIFSNKDKKPYMDVLKKLHKLVLTSEYDEYRELLNDPYLKFEFPLVTEHRYITGYYIMDINGDGINELLVGNAFLTDGKDDDFNRLVYQVYTIKDGKPVSLYECGARFRYYLTSDNKLFFMGSSAADDSTVALYELPKKSDTLVELWKKHNDPSAKDSVEIKTINFRPLLFDDDLAE